MTRAIRLFAVLVGLSLGSGCATFSTMQMAKPVDPGKLELGASAALSVNAVPNLIPGLPLPLPVLEVSGRYGIGPRADIGFRARPIGITADTKFQFHKSDSLDASFGPGIGWGGIGIPGSGGFQEVDVHIPVYFGKEYEQFGWMLGPKAIARYMINSQSGDLSGSQSRFLLMTGGVAALRLRFGKNFGLGGEINVYYDVTENTGLAGEAGIGLFLDFGGRK